MKIKKLLAVFCFFYIGFLTGQDSDVYYDEGFVYSSADHSLFTGNYAEYSEDKAEIKKFKFVNGQLRAYDIRSKNYKSKARTLKAGKLIKQVTNGKRIKKLKFEQYPVLLMDTKLVENATIPIGSKDTVRLYNSAFDALDLKKSAYYVVYSNDCKTPLKMGRMNNGEKTGEWKVYGDCSIDLLRIEVYEDGDLVSLKSTP